MREQKITLGEMRSSGPTRLLVYCGDYKCAHSVVIDTVYTGRVSDVEPKFTCQACGHRGAEVGALFAGISGPDRETQNAAERILFRSAALSPKPRELARVALAGNVLRSNVPATPRQ